MLNMSIGDVIKLVDVSGVDEKVVVELVDSLREAFQEWVMFLRHHIRVVGNASLIVSLCRSYRQYKPCPFDVGTL